ncbi:MAG: hypothetical protein QXP04_04870 [Candidatus Nanoarchaeia archaeon]|nr:hypothetical protein [Candidatus Jingweiarchaeum tengchongense]
MLEITFYNDDMPLVPSYKHIKEWFLKNDRNLRTGINILLNVTLRMGLVDSFQQACVYRGEEKLFQLPIY